jgi:hypothetical protein
MIKAFIATPDDLILGSVAGNLAGLCKGVSIGFITPEPAI